MYESGQAEIHLKFSSVFFFILIDFPFCRPAVLVSSQPPPTRPTGNETLAQILDRSAKYDFGSLQP